MALSPVRTGMLLVAMLASGFACSQGRAEPGEVRLARFSADVTIPLGHRCMGVLPVKASTIVDPLQVHGVVLLSDEQPVVLAAFDWCEIRNGAYDTWRRTLATAAQTSVERVLVCSLHQHDAPVIDSGAQAWLDQVGLEGELFDTAFHTDCLQRVSQAVQDCLESAQPVTHIGLGNSRVARVASNRRLVHLDGRVSFDRYSSGGGEAFQADAPPGLIDPMLKTISFWNREQPLLAINHFAVHPMSYYGRGGVSYDFVGMAREQWRRESGVPQIYVSGCSGDVVAGKYNDGSTESRTRLAERLREAMEQAWNATERQPIEQLSFRNAVIELPFHESGEFSEEALSATLHDENAATTERILAAMGLSSRMRLQAGAKIDLPCLDFGSAQMLLLPGEAFVGYQIMAQQMRPESFVMAIGYGECWPGYIPTDAAFEDGFDHGWRWAGPGSESAMRAGLRQVLQPSSSVLTHTGRWQQITLPEAIKQRCLVLLEEGLSSDRFWPSMHAAEALATHYHAVRDGAGLERLKRELAARLEAQRDDQRRCGLARELVRAGAKGYTRILLEILADADSSGRVHAAESLFKIDEIGDGAALRAAAEQTADSTLRLMACGALAGQGNRQAADVIRTRLASGDAEELRIAAWLLGRVGTSSDIASLQKELQSLETPLARAFVQHSIAALGDTEGIVQLGANLASEDPVVRAHAATVAGQARATSVVDLLMDRLDDADLDVRIRAADALLTLERTPREPDQDVSYQVFPATELHPRYTEGSIVELSDGALLFAISEFTGDGSDFSEARIVAKKSSDGGRTWGPSRVLQENVGGMNVMSVTLRRLGPPNQWESPLGMFYLVKNSHKSLDLYLRISQDEAASFGEPIEINRRDGYHVMNNDRVTCLSSGRLLAPVAYSEDVQASNHFVSYCFLSDDDGQTWRRGQGAVDQPGRGAMEPEVVELSDGKVMMIVRTQLGRIAAAHSSDGGDSWGEAFLLPVDAPEAPATIRRLPATGDLLLIWNHTYVPGERHGGRRTPLTAATSSDEGATWHGMRDLESRTDRTYAYTSLAFVGRRAVMSYWEQESGAARYSARFRSLPVQWFYGDDAPKEAAETLGQR